MIQPKPDPPRGVLHHARDEPVLGLERFEPSGSLADFVEHYWSVTWERQPRVARETVPHPAVHLVIEPGRSELHGVHPLRFTRVIEGTGRVLGVRFRPGGFRAFAKGSVARLTGRVLDPSSCFGPSIRDLETETSRFGKAADAFERIDAYLRRLDPPSTDDLLAVNRIVESIAADRSILRADAVADRSGIPLRQLQRLFRDHVGVSPKWVIRRHRLIEAAERLRDPAATTDLAALALDLGYSDQPHFIRDFKQMVGSTPAEYRESIRPRPDPA